MSHDEPDFVIAVHGGAARGVAHRTIEVVHAVPEHPHIREHPEPIIVLKLDDEGLVRRQAPVHVVHESPAALISLLRTSSKHRCGKSIYVLLTGTEKSDAEHEVRPVPHGACQVVAGPAHGIEDRFVSRYRPRFLHIDTLDTKLRRLFLPAVKSLP